MSSWSSAEARRFGHYMAYLSCFDFILSTALLIICGDESFGSDSDQPKIFNKDFWDEEVPDFSFSVSMFDLMMLSFFRSLLLFLFYYVMKRTSSKMVVATTVLSILYCIVKYIFFHIGDSKWLAPALLLASLLLPCLEFWLWVSKRPNLDADSTGDSETAPLIVRHSINTTVAPTTPIAINASSRCSQEDEKFETPPEIDIDAMLARYTSAVEDRAPSSPPVAESVVNVPDTSVPPPPLHPALVALNSVFEVTEKMCGSNEGWDYVLEKRGVRVYQRKTAGSGANHLKGVMWMPFSPAQVLEYSMVMDERTSWNKAINSQRVIEVLSSAARITHTVFKAPYPVTPRDFVYVEGSRTQPDGSLLSGVVSFETPSCPPQKGMVRGELLYSGFHAVPDVGGTGCTVTYVIAIDLKGWIPPAIINRANLEQPTCLADLCDSLGKYLTRNPTFPNPQQ